MNLKKSSHLLFLPCALLLLTVLSACGKKDDGQTVGQQLDIAVAKTEQAAADAKAKAQMSMSNAENVLKDATSKAEAAGKSTADKVAGTMSDVSITSAVSAVLARDADLSALKINVDTKNGKVTLNGPASSIPAKEKASTLAKAVKGVVSVDNKLVVKGS